MMDWLPTRRRPFTCQVTLICLCVLLHCLHLPSVNAQAQIPDANRNSQPLSNSLRRRRQQYQQQQKEEGDFIRKGTTPSCWYEAVTDAPTSVSSEDGLIDCGPRTRLTVTPTISKEDRLPSTGTIWADKPFDYNIRLRFDESSLNEEFRIKVDEQPTAFISLAICPYQILEDIESQPCHALHRRNITESDIEMDDFFSGQEDMVVVDQPTSPLQILSVSSIDPIPLERREEHSELFLETTIQTSFDVVGNYYLIAVASILVQNEAEQEMKVRR